MVQRVADHHVLLLEDRLEEAAVGIEARAVEDRVLRAEEGGEPRLEFLVHGLGAADEAHRRHAEAVLAHSDRGSIDERRVVGEAEVVVGTEVDDASAISELDVCGLRRGDDALVLEQPFVHQTCGASLQVGQ